MQKVASYFQKIGIVAENGGSEDRRGFPTSRPDYRACGQDCKWNEWAGTRRLSATGSSAGSNHRGRNRGETLNTHACVRLEWAGQNIATRAGSVSAHTQMPASDRGNATLPSRLLLSRVRPATGAPVPD